MNLTQLSISLLLCRLLILFFFFSVFSDIILLFHGINSFVIIGILIIYIIYLSKIKLNFKIIFLSISVLLFQFSFIFYGQIKGYNLINTLYLSRYLLIFMIFPIVYYLVKLDYISKLVLWFSRIMMFKIFIIVLIALCILYFDFNNYLIQILWDKTALKPYFQIDNFLRLFDSFAPFFPLVFQQLFKSKSYKIQFVLHIILLAYIIFVGSIGILVAYIIILNLLNKKNFSYIIVLIIIIYFSFFNLINSVIEAKLISFIVKDQQYSFIIEQYSFFGSGIGYEFNINGREGFLLENLYLYWFHTYGVIGFCFYIILFIVIPMIIVYKYKNNNDIYLLGLTYLSLIISSASNPYLMSGTSILILLILYSYHICFLKSDINLVIPSLK